MSPPVDVPQAEAPSRPRVWTGPLPTRYQLGAAVRVASLLSPDGTSVSVARGAYRTHVSGGVYRSVDLIGGERLLGELGLLYERDGTLYVTPDCADLANAPDADARELLLGWLLDNTPPAWLGGALDPDGEVAFEYVPDEAAAALRGLFGGEELAIAFLCGRAVKVDPERNSETGCIAEKHVAAVAADHLRDAGREDLARLVRRISEVDDRAGYDVAAPRLDRSPRHLEVKGTRGTTGVIRVIISRNEIARGLHDPNWYLVVCRVVEERSSIVGWCSAVDFERELPVDQPGRARWHSVALSLRGEQLTPGLPPHSVTK